VRKDEGGREGLVRKGEAGREGPVRKGEVGRNAAEEWACGARLPDVINLNAVLLMDH
jgi:hypothetical protein